MRGTRRGGSINLFYLAMILILIEAEPWQQLDLRLSEIPCLSAGLVISLFCLVLRSTPLKEFCWWSKVISRLILPWFIIMKHICSAKRRSPVLPSRQVQSDCCQSFALFLCMIMICCWSVLSCEYELVADGCVAKWRHCSAMVEILFCCYLAFGLMGLAAQDFKFSNWLLMVMSCSPSNGLPS